MAKQTIAMTVSMPNNCPQCRAPLPTDRLAGLCPACFFSAATFDQNLRDEGERSAVHVPGLQVGEELARGGMGVVYAAEQHNPQRSVAIKILLPQWCGNEAVRERFRREAHSMAGLEHPTILPVYAVGETDGLPWFTMKLATGGSLAGRIPAFVGKWTWIAELADHLAGALAFAHERGVLHRDLKPGNILFDAEDNAYLADFGLAKRRAADADDMALTLDADVLGTPNYLAPELASGVLRTATTSSDIYSLGAVLYELLTGEPPHREENLPALLRRVADHPPAPIISFVPRPPRDLCAICEKAMAREPERRYATAREMADDLQLFLSGRAVRARQASALELLWHWCRRHPAVTSLLTLVVALLVALAVGSTVAVVRIGRAEREAVSARDRAQASLRRSLLAEAEGVRRARLPRFRAHALQRVADAGAPDESPEMRLDRRSEAIAALAFPEMQKSAMPTGPDAGTMAVLAPGHEFAAWRNKGGAGWSVTRLQDGEVLSRTPTRGVPARLNRSGHWLGVQVEGAERWQIWDLSLRASRLEAEWPGAVEDLSDDGSLAAFYYRASSGENIAEVREIKGGRTRFQLRFPQVTLKMRFNGDGTQCAVAPSSYLNEGKFPYSVRIHDCRDGAVTRELSAGLGNCIWSMAFSRDGTLLAASERGGATFLWEALSGNSRQTLRGTGASMWQMAFSDDSRRLATISDDRLLTVFDTVGGQPIARGGEAWLANGVPQISWSSISPWTFGPLAVDGENTLITMRPSAFSTFVAPGSHGSALGLGLSPDSRWLAVGDSRDARLWDLTGARPMQTFAAGLWNSFAFSPDGRWLFGGGEPGVARWSLGDEGVVEGSRAMLLPGGYHNGVALDRAGGVLAAEDAGAHAISLFSNLASVSPVRRGVPTRGTDWIALSPDGARLAAAGRLGLRVWRVTDGSKIFDQPQPAGYVAFNADGTCLLAGRQQYEILDASSGALLRTLPAKPIELARARAAFSSDGRWLGTGHPFGRIALWDTATWSLLCILESPNRQPVGRFVFDSGGTHLFCASTSGIIEQWDLRKLREDLKTHSLDW